MEKWITPLLAVEREVARTDKNGEETTKTISFTLWFIDSAKFMANSLSSLVNILPEKNHKAKCKYSYDDKKSKTFGIKIASVVFNTQDL